MERITVNLEKEAGVKFREKAKAENRTASGHLEYLVIRDLEAAGLIVGKANDSARKQEAMREAESAGVDVVATLTRAARRAR